MFDRLLEDIGCTYESAGAIRDGRRVWILARIPESMQVAGDELRKYFLVVLSHDGSLPLILKPTPVRVVCNNTLNIALRDRSNQFAVRHLRGMRERMREITDAIVEAGLNFQQAREHMERMTDYRLIAEEAVRRLLESNSALLSYLVLRQWPEILTAALDELKDPALEDYQRFFTEPTDVHGVEVPTRAYGSCWKYPAEIEAYEAEVEQMKGQLKAFKKEAEANGSARKFKGEGKSLVVTFRGQRR